MDFNSPVQRTRIAISLLTLGLAYLLAKGTLSHLLAHLQDLTTAKAPVVEIDSFDYFRSQHSLVGQYKISVRPITGDPDLYIAFDRPADYTINDYDLCSSSCGVEEIEFELEPDQLCHIAVYCFSSTEPCVFQLNIDGPTQEVLEEKPRADKKQRYSFNVDFEDLFWRFLKHCGENIN